MKIQQHDGVVVDAAGSRQGFAKRKRGGRGVTGGREVPGLGVLLPSPSHIYIGARERGAGPLTSNLRRGRRPGGLPCPPRQGGAPL